MREQRIERPWTVDCECAVCDRRGAANSAKDTSKNGEEAGLQSHAPCRNQEPCFLSRSCDRVLAGSVWISVCNNAGEIVELLKSLNFDEQKLALAGAAAAIGGA